MMIQQPSAASPVLPRTTSSPRTTVASHTIERAIWLVGVVTLVGFVLRAWQIGAHPAGLLPDEASIGYESFAILTFGMDRNAVPYPAHLIAWGSGQNVLYAYVAAPFVAALGLSEFSIRLPMLFAGILCIPLVWRVARATFGVRPANLAALFLSLSPWHIMLSRWALESNLLVFTFLLGYACLLRAFKRPRWLIPACVSFALCLYAYGTAYLGVPLFLAGCIPILWRVARQSKRALLLGLALAALVALPIVAFVAVNVFKLASTQLGPLGIPRMPASPRYETVSILFRPDAREVLTANVERFAKLMWSQDDGLIWNALPGIGFAYGPVTLILACLGIGVATVRARKRTVWLLLWWTVVGLLVSAVQEPNINRSNLVLLPFHIWAAVAAAYLAWNVWARRLVAVAAIAACAVFLNAYFITYRDKLAEQFFEGLPASMARAVRMPGERVCVTDQANMPYIYALFADRTDPRVFNRTVVYLNPQDPFRQVASFGRYTFGVQRCDPSAQVFVLRGREQLPPGARVKPVGQYGDFVVYQRD